MFNVKLYKFAKRNDSTKQPVESTGVEYQCVLKDNTGVLAPVFRFKYSAIEQIYSNNYMFVPEFNRYYFLNDWEWNAGEWVSSWTVDPLATYRTQISNLTATIERSSNYLFYNQKIHDSMAILSDTVGFRTSKISSLIADFAKDPTDGGFFIVGINNGQSVSGGVAYYALTFRAFHQTINYLMKQNPFNWETTLNNKVNPLQYINSIYWCPLMENQFIESNNEISSIILFDSLAGDVAIDLDPEWGQCYSIFNSTDPQTGLIKYLQYEIKIPALTVPEWIASTAFRYTVTAPFLGTVDMPAEIIAKNSDVAKTLFLKYKINMNDGTAIVNISTTSGTSYSTFFDNVVCTFNTRVGVNVLYGDRQSNIGDVLFNSMSSLLGSITSGSIIAGNPTPATTQVSTPQTSTAVVPYSAPVGPYTGGSGASGGSDSISLNLPTMGGFNAMGGAMGVLSAIGSFSSNTIVRGASSSYLDAIDYIHLTIYEREQINQYDIGDLGLPCETVANIGVVADVATYGTTFIKCRTAHVDFNCTSTERSMIESYLLNGFHFE